MVTNLREMLIARKYCDRAELIQAYFDLPAGTTITVTYSPPKNYVYIPVWIKGGEMPYGVGIATAYADRTLSWGPLYGTNVIMEALPWTPNMYIKSILEVITTNVDVVSHTVDFMLGGFLIPISLLDEFIEEVTGRRDRKVMEKQNEKLDKLDETLLRIEKLLAERPR